MADTRKGEHFNQLLCVLNVSHRVSTINRSVVLRREDLCSNSAVICLWSVQQTIMLPLIALS